MTRLATGTEERLTSLSPSSYRTIAATFLVLLVGVIGGLSLRFHSNKFQVTPLGVRDMILQSTPTTCGPAALAYIMRYHGIDVSEDNLQVLAKTGQSGTSLLNLAQAANHLGFQATGYQTDYQGLSSYPLPFIAVFDTHFVVVTRVTPQSVEIGDPLSGFHLYGRKAFLQLWKRQVLVLER